MKGRVLPVCAAALALAGGLQGASGGGRKQLFVLVDMEGASGITEKESSWLIHGSKEWREFGREVITSDVKAVCEAARDFGIDEILIYDMHFAGSPEPNIDLEALPDNVKLVDVPDRRMDMRRIRGQVAIEPFGMVFVGQHARAGTPNSYFPHSIQPKWKELRVNGLAIAEIGYTAFSFPEAKLLAVVGDAAAMSEARELYPRVAAIPVKDKARNWAPSHKETYRTIRDGVSAAFSKRDSMQSLLDTVLKTAPDAYDFSLTLHRGFYFEIPAHISWKGRFTRDKATWQAPSAQIGLEILWDVNACARQERRAPEGR